MNDSSAASAAIEPARNVTPVLGEETSQPQDVRETDESVGGTVEDAGASPLPDSVAERQPVLEA